MDWLFIALSLGFFCLCCGFIDMACRLRETEQ